MELIDRDDGVAVLRMNAGKANAVGPEFLAGLGRSLDAWEKSGATALVLTGYDRFFSAGLDLLTLSPLDRPAMRSVMREFHDVFLRVFVCPRPVVAAVNGHAIAGGCVLALTADHRVLVEDGARFGLNEAQLGVGLPVSALEPLRVVCPPGLAFQRAALLGELFEPGEALALGLVEELAPAGSVEERAVERAARLAAVPRVAYAQIKASVRRPFLERAEAVRESDLEAWLDTWFSEEARERIGVAVARLG